MASRALIERPHVAKAHESGTSSLPAAVPAPIDAYTPYSHEWSNSDGTVSAVVSSGPRFYQDASGTWQQIDLHVVAGSDGSYLPRANANIASLGDVASGTAATLQTSAGPISLSHPGANAISGLLSTDGLSLSYPAALSGGLGLSEQFLSEGFEEAVTIPTVASPGSYQDTFSFPSGVTTNVTDEALQFFSDGTQIAQFGPAYATDSYEGGAVAQADISITSSSGSSVTVSVAAPSQWLDDPARVFPVTIDPAATLTTGTSCGTTSSFSGYDNCDTYDSQDAPYGFNNDDVGYYAYPYLRVGSPATCTNGQDDYPNCTIVTTHTDLQFPIYDVGGATGDPGYNVTSATLSLTLESDQLNPPAPSPSAHSYNLHEDQSAIGTNTYWENQPTWGPEYSSGTTQPSGPYSWNVTSIANDWMRQAQVPYGISISADDEDDPSAFRVFYSADAGEYAPSLYMTWAGNPGPAQNLTATPASTSTTVTWTAADPNGGSIADYYLTEYNGNFTQAYQQVTICGSCTLSYTFTGETPLTTYGFWIYDTNNYGSGSEPTSTTATTTVGQPGPPTNLSATAGPVHGPGELGPAHQQRRPGSQRLLHIGRGQR